MLTACFLELVNEILEGKTDSTNEDGLTAEELELERKILAVRFTALFLFLLNVQTSFIAYRLGANTLPATVLIAPIITAKSGCSKRKASRQGRKAANAQEKESSAKKNGEEEEEGTERRREVESGPAKRSSAHCSSARKIGMWHFLTPQSF
jgi:hypothetical protein